MIVFKNYLPSLLPDYIKQEDSYKDGSGKGFLVRYLEIFGEDLDEQFYLKLEGFKDNLSPLSSQADYLDLFAIMLGDIQNFSDNEDDYRRFLTYIISIYQTKGRVKSYKAVLGLLGLTVSINEIPLVAVLYDSGISYDAEPILEYDSSCETCSNYEITLTGPNPINGILYSKILGLIALVEPINAKLSKLTYNGDEITSILISVEIDADGNLIYDNTADPDLILTLVNGDLIISGPNANKYYLDNGDLYFIQ